MKKLLLLIMICTYSILFTNCSKPSAKHETAIDTVSVDIDKYAELNNKLAKTTNINTPVDLINYYYGNIENTDDVKITSKQTELNQYLITLNHLNIKDDSISEIMVLMKANNSNGDWTVLDIDRKWKCQNGRGHSDYSSEPCL